MVVGELDIRPTEHMLPARGRPLKLTVRQLDLLTALAERRDRIVSREELYESNRPPMSSSALRTSTRALGRLTASCHRAAVRPV